MIADNMEQFEYSCYNSISNWLNAHFFDTVFLLIWLAIIIVFICPDQLLMFVCPYQFYEYFNEGSADIPARRFLLFIIFELALMSTYIFCALFLRWVFNIGPITPMIFNRWIIEACYGPIIIEILVYFISRYPSIEETDIINESFHFQFACIIKLVLFLIKRYLEFYPTSEYNNVQIRSFYDGCKISSRNNNSNFKPLAFPFYHF
jgi:hypothetical protein